MERSKRNKERGSKKYTIKEVVEYIDKEDMKMKLVSTEYISANTPMLFECLVCEHVFSKRFSTVTAQGKSCPACGKNKERVSKDDINKIVESRNYTVSEFHGGDSRRGTVFTVECQEGHIYKTSYREFMRKEFDTNGGSCNTCREEGNSPRERNRRKLLNDSVLELGYKIKNGKELSTVKDKRIFLCELGHERETTLSELKMSSRCATCEGRVLRHTESSIRKLLEDTDIEYLGGWDKTTKHVDYLCECGNKTSGYIYSVLKGRKCEECLNYRIRDLSNVKQFFKNYGCSLLEDSYSNTKDYLRFLCKCGDEGVKTFNEFYYRPYCKTCGINMKPRGEDHPSYSHSLSREYRENNRKYIEYYEWRRAVYERDRYTCQCCGDNTGGNLVAHHILNYSEHEDLRTELSNGITLCDIDCHKRFHDTYGYRENNIRQLEEFISIIREEQARIL